MFKAIRISNREKKKEKVDLKCDESLITDKSEIVSEITDYFQGIFFSANEQKSDIEPTQMTKPFTKEEVKAAVKCLKNNKRPGPDKTRICASQCAADGPFQN